MNQFNRRVYCLWIKFNDEQLYLTFIRKYEINKSHFSRSIRWNRFTSTVM